jgi:hypothetical protein
MLAQLPAASVFWEYVVRILRSLASSTTPILVSHDSQTTQSTLDPGSNRA